MKRILLLAFLAGSVSLGYAQTKPASDLKLSEQQSKKLQDINRSYMASTSEIRKNDALSKEEKKAKVENLQADRTGQIKTVLDASQFEQWQKNQSASKEKMANLMEKRKGKEGKKGGRMKDNSDETIKELGLTEKQGEDLKSINKEFAAKAMELKGKTDLTKEQKKEQAKALKAERSAKLKTSLGDAQYEKYEALRKDAKGEKGKKKKAAK
ncbi:hypothetical protein GFS24_13770 [Chitinophaga sp. SYP-B3965]|uniref:hypothetical protein n=1 Tax=Chitinophaga sp. SYP-B3965 TaxID=2663120 RepID=UPI001299A80D|nr:hypothetical protein [Chitinophaga sp. SYP-B3965]MRG46185.1 hypothetical protein [Chitinophaga sp. SYP-B3965]